MPLVDKDPFGLITLVDYDNEYSGGNKEDIRVVTLAPAAADRNIRLIENNSHIDTWPKGQSSQTEQEWEISVDELITLIKTNGRQTK